MNTACSMVVLIRNKGLCLLQKEAHSIWASPLCQSLYSMPSNHFIESSLQHTISEIILICYSFEKHLLFENIYINKWQGFFSKSPYSHFWKIGKITVLKIELSVLKAKWQSEKLNLDLGDARNACLVYYVTLQNKKFWDQNITNLKTINLLNFLWPNITMLLSQSSWIKKLIQTKIGTWL